MNIENRALPAQWYIRAFVFTLHSILILFIWLGGHQTLTKQTPQRLSVRTVSLTPRSPAPPQPAPTIVAEAVPDPAPAPAPAPQPAPQPTPQPKKIEIKKTVATKQQKKVEVKQKAPDKPAAKAVDHKQSALIADALASLDKSAALQNKRAAPSKAQQTRAPTAVATLSTESHVSVEEDTASLSPQERTYVDELVQRLKLQLKLPEYGEVEIQLTLSRLGKVISVVCAKSKATKNSKYVEKKLKEMHFPPFGTHFPDVQEHTFRLQLKSDFNY
ncbi:MAG: hypothetical protein JSR46_01195 [Verrucomicrobia bacterium]|nr:hypothetical protein [Verrucomicrobiota bacterium]